jgi:hypothetical protein
LQFVAKAGPIYTIINGNFPKRNKSCTRSRGVNGVSAVSTATNTNANYLPFLVHTYKTDNNIDFSTQAGVTNEQFSQQVVRVSASDLIALRQMLIKLLIAVSMFRLKQEDFDMYKNL